METVKENIEPGKLLKIVGVILSIVLMLQLYAISETIDLGMITDVWGKDLVGVLLVISYLLTSISMVTVVYEFFRIKKKVNNLLEMTQLLDRIEALQFGKTLSPQISTPNSTSTPQTLDFEDNEEEFSFESLGITEDEPEQALKTEATIKGVLEDSHYKTVAVKLEDEDETTAEEDDKVSVPDLLTMNDDEDDFDLSPEPEPTNVLVELANQRTREVEEEKLDAEVVKMLNESEIMETLGELQKVAEELRKRKNKVPVS